MRAPLRSFDGLQRTVGLAARKWAARIEVTRALFHDCSQAELAAGRQSA